MKTFSMTDELIHELKSSLTIIRGFAETLLEQNVSEEVRRSSLERILRACARLENLTKESKKETVDLVLLTQGCIESILAKYPHAKISLKATNFSLQGDASLLETALMNLLDNAVKYSSAAVEVIITPRKIEVKDSGMGIESDDLEKIFDRFYRTSAAKAKPGSGLGLTMVKKIVEQHGGQVKVFSTVGEGSLFTLLF